MAVRCTGCDKELDYYTTRFDKDGSKIGDFCRRCAGGGLSNVAGSGFPFTTTNLGGDPSKPITVNSLYHLRKLESQHGVQSSAYNTDSRNFQR